MSFDKLPKETLDQICEEVGKLGREGTQTFLTLSLTSHFFLPSARNALYRAPLSSLALRKSHSRLARLLHTLQQSPHLAKRVKRIHKFDSVVLRATLTSDADGFAPYEWQRMLVEVCTQARRISLRLQDESYARDLASTVAVRHPDCLKLSFDTNSNARAVFASWLGAYRSPSPSPHLQVYVQQHEHDTKPPQVDYSTRRLRLILASGCPQTGTLYLPSSLDALTHLTLDVRNYQTCNCDFAGLFSSLRGNSVKFFSFLGLDGFEAEEVYLDRWWEGHQEPPLSAYSSFPHLQKLQMRRVAELSFEKLSLLAPSSPSLTKLDLRTCTWTFSYADFHPFPGIPSVEGKLIDVLRRFPNLKKADLGVFPLRKVDGALAGLATYASDAGIELKWAGLGQMALAELAE